MYGPGGRVEHCIKGKTVDDQILSALDLVWSEQVRKDGYTYLSTYTKGGRKVSHG